MELSDLGKETKATQLGTQRSINGAGHAYAKN